jgi:hypothetical protein
MDGGRAKRRVVHAAVLPSSKRRAGAEVGAVGLPGIGRAWDDYLTDKHDIITRLRENEAVLRARGVAHAALFGSVLRGDLIGTSVEGCDYACFAADPRTLP